MHNSNTIGLHRSVIDVWSIVWFHQTEVSVMWENPLFPQLPHVQSKDLPTISPSLKSSLDVLATLLQYKAHLKALLPSDFLHKVWTELASQDVSACLETLYNSEHMQLVFEAATEKELYAILQDLKVITVSVHCVNIIFTSVLGDCLKIGDPCEFE